MTELDELMARLNSLDVELCRKLTPYIVQPALEALTTRLPFPYVSDDVVAMFRGPLSVDAFVTISEASRKAYGDDLVFDQNHMTWSPFLVISRPKETT